MKKTTLILITIASNILMGLLFGLGVKKNSDFFTALGYFFTALSLLLFYLAGKEIAKKNGQNMVIIYYIFNLFMFWFSFPLTEKIVEEIIK